MRTFAALGALWALAACADAPTPPAAPSDQPSLAASGAPDLRDRWIVELKLDEGDPGGFAKRVVAEHGGTVHYVYRGSPGFAATLPAGAVEALRRNPRVRYVAPDGIATLDATQSSAPWGLDRSDQRTLPLSTTYTYEAAGEGVTAYIVDTGIRFGHTDFGGRASLGTDVIGDGRAGGDCNGHGTHVAGTVGGTKYGMAKRATLKSVRVFACADTTTVSAIVGGLDWIKLNHVKPAVVNMSLRVHVSLSASVDERVQQLLALGVPVVAAAGNFNADACLQSPAFLSGVITVGATASNDARWTSSNWGLCVDLNAPGVSVVSASHLDNTSPATKTGTSMATPHVAGAVARYLEVNPAATPADAHAWVVGNATTGRITGLTNATPNRLLWVDPTLRRAVASVTVTPNPLSAWVGYSYGMTATAYDASGRAITGRAATFTSADPSIARVTAGGTVTGVAPGTTYVYAAIEGVTSAGARVDVSYRPPDPLSVNGITVQQPAPAYAECGHYANTSGGVQPFTYQWYVNGVPQPPSEWGSGMLYTNQGVDYEVSVTVTDGIGATGSFTRIVTVSAPDTGPIQPACLQ